MAYLTITKDVITICILSYLPSGVDVDVTGLLNGGINNPDGHGWAIADPTEDKILFGHSLFVEDALEEFIEVREKHMNGPALFHSRWATHGSIKPANCHPFKVNGSNQTVLAHNGILPANAHPEAGDDRSDTKILAEDLMPRWYSRLDNRRTRQNLARWAGDYNKLVILTVDPKYRRNVYLVNENAGMWDHKTGIWHSNGDFKDAWRNHWTYTQVTTKTSTKAITAKPLASKDDGLATKDVDWEIVYDADGYEVCHFCEGRVQAATHYCVECGSCADCYEHLSDCLCMMTGSTHNSPVNLREDYTNWATSAPYNWDIG